MELTTGKLGLLIPEQTKACGEHLAMEAEAIKAWRATLPMSNVSLTAKMVYQAITDSHNVTLTPKERFEILELFRLPSQFVCQSLRKYFVGQENAITEKKRKIASLAQAIQTEMATGYKIIVEQLANNNTNKNLLPLAIHRTISYYANVLLRSYLLYSPEPNNIWRELHILYRLAESKKLHKNNICQNEQPMLAHYTIIDAYKHALLLSIAQPYRLQQCQIQQLHVALETWVNFVDLNDYKRRNKDVFIVDLISTSPPSYQSQEEVVPSNSCRTINTAHILSRMEQLLEEKEKPSTNSNTTFDPHSPEWGVSSSLLRHLIQTWTAHRVRNFKRTTIEIPLTLSFGISGTYNSLINLKNDSEDELSDDDYAKAIAVSYNDDEEISYESNEPAQFIEDSNPEYKTYECKTIDISNGGYCIKWDSNEPIPASAGEIIGINCTCDDGSKTWQVGNIRWMKQSDDLGLHFGVLILAYQAKPANGQITRAGKKVGRPLKVLMVPEVDCQSHQMTLITPSLPFKTGDTVSIEVDNSHHEVKLGEIINQSASFNQFKYQLAESKNENLPQMPPKLDANGLNSIVNDIK